MEILVLVFYGCIIASLVLLPYLFYLAIQALKIYIAKNAVVEPRPAYTRFEEADKKSDSNP